MSRIGETASRPHAEVFSGHVDPARAHQDLLRGLDGKQACPFCGAVSERTSSACQRCGMENTPEARKATKARIGPWYVLQARNPAAPGMRFETLLGFVRKGRVRARSVVRGPTTHQLWRFAAHVKGLSREFGLCYSCGSAIEPTANVCPQCNRLQEPPVNPDVLLEDKGEDGSSAAAAAAAAGRTPVYRELPEPGKSASGPVEPAPPAKPEPEDAEIVIPALGAFRPDDVEVKPLEPAPAAAPQIAPVPVPNWFASSPAVPPASSPAPRSSSPRPPLDENPFAIPSPPPRKKNNNGGGDTFLSAKELAAAFKLSFDPSANLDAVDVPDEMPAAALPEGLIPGIAKQPLVRSQLQLQQPSSSLTGPAGVVVPPPRRRGSRLAAVRRVALFMVILAGTGFGVMMWVDPVFRQKTVDWGKASFAKLHAYATAQDMKSQPAPSHADKGAKDESAMPTPPATPREPAVEPKAKSPIEQPKAPAEPEAASPKTPEPPAPPPAPAPRPAAPAPSAAVKTAVPVPAPAEPKPAPQAPMNDASAKAPAEQEEPIPVTHEEQVARKRQLYKLGVQAESKSPPDYAAAFKAYSDIKKLPAEVWPSDLEYRLSRVQKKLK
jgi:uncharacterized OB-fold protein